MADGLCAFVEFLDSRSDFAPGFSAVLHFQSPNVAKWVMSLFGLVFR